MIAIASLSFFFETAAACFKISLGDKRTALRPSSQQSQDRAVPGSIALCAVSPLPGRGCCTLCLRDVVVAPCRFHASWHVERSSAKPNTVIAKARLFLFRTRSRLRRGDKDKARWRIAVNVGQRCVERAVAEGPLAALDDRPRPGREPTITPEAKAWPTKQPFLAPRQTPIAPFSVWLLSCERSVLLEIGCNPR